MGLLPLKDGCLHLRGSPFHASRGAPFAWDGFRTHALKVGTARTGTGACLKTSSVVRPTTVPCSNNAASVILQFLTGHCPGALHFL